jgi:hypothetical protein
MKAQLPQTHYTQSRSLFNREVNQLQNPLTKGNPKNVYRCLQKRQVCMQKEGAVFPKGQMGTVKWKLLLEYKS